MSVQTVSGKKKAIKPTDKNLDPLLLLLSLKEASEMRHIYPTVFKPGGHCNTWQSSQPSQHQNLAKDVKQDIYSK